MRKAIGVSYILWQLSCVILILILIITVSSCAPVDTKSEPLPALYFPAPPDEPRFVYERSVRGSADLLVDDDASRMRRLLTGERTTTMAFSKPFDVTACRGTMYVSDTVSRSVFAFNASDNKFFIIGDRDPGLLSKPLGLAIDAKCRLYVADASRGAIEIYEQDGSYVNSIGGARYFDRLSHLAVNPEGSLLFAVDTGGVDSENHHVRVFDLESGNHLYDIGTRGSEPGQFNLPRDIALANDGSIHVVDGGNFRVQVFDQKGEFLREFGSNGRQLGQFARPKGIGLDSENNSYISDASHGNFQIFDPQNTLLLFVGSRSEQNDRAKYMLPAGLHVDEDGRVYMVDQYFKKVDIYRPAGMEENQGYLGTWGSNPVE